MTRQPELPRSSGKQQATDEDRFYVANASGYQQLRANERRIEGEEPYTDEVGQEVLRGRSPSTPADPVAGMSTFNDLTNAQLPLRGPVWRIPAGTSLPESVGLHKDGANYGGTVRSPPDHATLYPTRDMTLNEWDRTMSDFTSAHADRVGKLGRDKGGASQFQPTPEYAQELAERQSAGATHRSEPAGQGATHDRTEEQSQHRDDHERQSDARVRKSMAEASDEADANDPSYDRTRARGAEGTGREL